MVSEYLKRDHEKIIVLFNINQIMIQKKEFVALVQKMKKNKLKGNHFILLLWKFCVKKKKKMNLMVIFLATTRGRIFCSYDNIAECHPKFPILHLYKSGKQKASKAFSMTIPGFFKSFQYLLKPELITLQDSIFKILNFFWWCVEMVHERNLFFVLWIWNVFYIFVCKTSQQWDRIIKIILELVNFGKLIFQFFYSCEIL